MVALAPAGPCDAAAADAKRKKSAATAIHPMPRASRRRQSKKPVAPPEEESDDDETAMKKGMAAARAKREQLAASSTTAASEELKLLDLPPELIQIVLSHVWLSYRTTGELSDPGTWHGLIDLRQCSHMLHELVGRDRRWLPIIAPPALSPTRRRCQLKLTVSSLFDYMLATITG